MTSSCRRKSSKEQGGGKKIPFTFGKVGEEEEKEEQRREAKKTGVVEKEGQRGRTIREDLETARTAQGKDSATLHGFPKHGRQGALPIPFLQVRILRSR